MHSLLSSKSTRHVYVLPVLLLEFLAISLTRAVLPSLLIESFSSSWVYFVMGCTECIRGLLAFVSCPLFGKLSDIIGRKVCLFVTVLGTCAPVCSLALLPVYHPHRMYIFITLLALSGIFSSTFTLTFAYISDTVQKRGDRVTAYGLALATFGLSFTIGPMAGGYLSHVTHDTPSSESSEAVYAIHPIGQQRVFTSSLVLTLLDLLYIYFILPESLPSLSSHDSHHPDNEDEHCNNDSDSDSETVQSTSTTLTQRLSTLRDNQSTIINNINPIHTIQIIHSDPLLFTIGQISFLYYTSLWAVVSTLILYAAKRFQLSPERLGELMSALGLSTMVAEAVLVRLIVPLLGERHTIQVGLQAFCVQCIILGLAYESWHLFICVLFSTLSHLVYPSLASLVSTTVPPEKVGEALGAVNGIKSLTEGFGPLCFGVLMTLSEESVLPGWPYLLAALVAYGAYKRSLLLPTEDDSKDEYVSELVSLKWRQKRKQGDGEEDDEEEEEMGLLSNMHEDDDENGEQ